MAPFLVFKGVLARLLQDTAVAPFLLFKGVLARLLLKRKRELQGPGLHVYTCTYVYGYGEI